MSQDNQGNRAWVVKELLFTPDPIQSLSRAETEPDFAPAVRANIFVGPRFRAIMTEDSEAHSISIVPVEYPIIVVEHPFGKLGVGLRLNFNVDQQPDILSASQEHAKQFVGHGSAHFRIANDFR